MMSISGQYVDGRSTRTLEATLSVDDDGQISCSARSDPSSLPLAEVSISERIGNIPRIVRFADGGQFITEENDPIDQVLRRHRRSRIGQTIHRLESRLHYAAAAILITAAVAFVLMRWGLPELAQAGAQMLPAATAASLDGGVLEALDSTLLAPTTLDSATQARIRTRFTQLVQHAPADFTYQLHFRQGKNIGPNALALASGNIVVTDELIRLAKHDDEILAVLAHEVGHVVHRHTLRRMLQSSVVTLASLLITGDLSGPTAMVAAMPVLIVEMQYSQAFEREADDYALAWLRAQHIDPAHFKRMLERLEADKPDRANGPSYLSTHPATEERVGKFSER